MQCFSREKMVFHPQRINAVDIWHFITVSKSQYKGELCPSGEPCGFFLIMRLLRKWQNHLNFFNSDFLWFDSEVAAQSIHSEVWKLLLWAIIIFFNQNTTIIKRLLCRLWFLFLNSHVNLSFKYSAQLHDAKH